MRAVVPVLRRRPRSSRWSRSASPSAAIDRQLRDDLVLILLVGAGRARRRRCSARGWSAAGSGGRRTGSARPRSPGCTSTTRPCCTPYARACCCSTTTAGCSSSTTRRAGCSTCPTTWSGRRLDDLGLAPGAGGRRPGPAGLARRHLPRRATACWWSARRRPRGTAATVGAVVTLRDHTELQSVTGELDVVRGLTESLRAQNHEAANRLHTVVSLIEMGRPEEAVEFATEELQLAQLLTDRVVGAVGDPVRRRAAARQVGRGRRARHRRSIVDGELGDVGDLPSRDLVTVLGQPGRQRLRRRGRRARTAGSTCTSPGGRAGAASVVGDSGDGLSAEDAAARARARLDDQGVRRRPAAASGWRSSRQVARRHGGSVDGRPAPTLGGARVHGRPLGGGAAMSVRVLVVEDEQLAAEAHAAYVGRVDGFEVAGVARSAGEAARFLAAPRGRPGAARHAPARRARARPASSGCARPATLVRRDRGDLGPRRRRRPARRRAGRGALPAQAVHVRDASAPSSSSTPPTAPSSTQAPTRVRPGRGRPAARLAARRRQRRRCRRG